MGNLRKDDTEKLAVGVVQLLFALILLVMLLMSFVGCGTIREVPIIAIERIEYRDSLVYLKDTVTIEIPKEKLVYVGPADTTSVLATSLAHSEAKIDKGILTHTLEQKGEIKAPIDTVFKVEYINKIIEKEVPIEVVKEVKYTPNWCWYNLIYSIVLTLLLIVRIYIKIKYGVRPNDTLITK